MHMRCYLQAAPAELSGSGEELEVTMGSVLSSSKAEHGDLLMSWEEDDSTSSDALSSWMRGEVCQKLVGIISKTPCAQVTTTAVRSGTVTKGQIRANLLDVVLELEGHHLKEQVAVKGSVRCGGSCLGAGNRGRV